MGDAPRPVWLEATESLYKKLNRIANEYDVSLYEVGRRGLDALLQGREQRSLRRDRLAAAPSLAPNLSKV